MHNSSAGYDLIVLWKVLSKMARIYAVCLFVFGTYASYSLACVFGGSGNLRGKAASTRAESRIANVRQIILLLLLLFGMTVADDVFPWFRAIRLAQWKGCDCIDATGLWGVFALAVFVALIFLHVFQWIASIRLQRHAADLSG
jgi:hypothetical protein